MSPNPEGGRHNDPQKKHSLGTVSKNSLLVGLNRFHGVPTSLVVGGVMSVCVGGEGSEIVHCYTCFFI